MTESQAHLNLTLMLAENVLRTEELQLTLAKTTLSRFHMVEEILRICVKHLNEDEITNALTAQMEATAPQLKAFDNELLDAIARTEMHQDRADALLEQIRSTFPQPPEQGTK